MKHSDDQFRARAREEYHVDGEVEVDDNAKVARSHPGDQGYNPVGAYVQAWVWVEFPEETETDPMRRTEMHQ